MARAIDLDVIHSQTIKLNRPQAGALLGKGHRIDLGDKIQEAEPDIVIVNHVLTPVQQRNLEREWRVKVIDRTGLILEIFGARAQTREGKIQVELAALNYQRSRLVRSWTHLERQRGGAGFMGGPGETQIEIDRRLIGERIAQLKKQLEQVRKNRNLQRRSRERVPYPIIALVGYTNAGKSTLFNALTGASVYAEDLPFATLDPTMRSVKLEDGRDVIFSDTVGFIADLPTHLVAAFRATLEQVVFANVILHVRDIADDSHSAQKGEVINTLHDLGVEYNEDERIIEVWNKIDSLDTESRDDLLRAAKFKDNVLPVSAITGHGFEGLLSRIADILSKARDAYLVTLLPEQGKALAWLYRHARVLHRRDEDERIVIEMEADDAEIGKFQSKFPSIEFNKSI